jgi:hypothetical protein
MQRLIIFLFLLFVISCQEIDVIQEPINLGAESKVMAVNSAVVKNNALEVTLATTPGAKYALAIYTFGGKEPVRKLGFTADSHISFKKISLDTLKHGMYDLKVINISGEEIKRPINHNNYL